MSEWILRNKKSFIQNYNDLDISPKFLKLLINRGFKNFEDIYDYINLNEKFLNDATELKGFDEFMKIIFYLKDSGRKIRIVGDYDVDGIISVYILNKTFKDVGLNVDFVIPHRIKDGYGINKEIVIQAKNDGIDTLITCDNGISAFEVVEFAKSQGLKIIITDHHDIQTKIDENGEKIFVIPNADSVVNPKQEDCNYKFKKLCGAGVCFKICSEVYKAFGFGDEGMKLLEFVAIATICDVVDLEKENRFIVKYGMDLINDSTNIGINAIIDANSLTKGKIFSYEIGFLIGPCLNALGRLESAKKGIELLLCDDFEKAKKMAVEIKNLNDKRKDLTLEGFVQCVNIIEENFYFNDKIILVYNENIHESVAGIIAGRIKEKYYKPTIVLTNSGEICKGSARSIEGINIFDVLTRSKSLLISFGGHEMAAGLSIAKNNIEKLRMKINSFDIDEKIFSNKIYVDLFLPIQDVDYKFVTDLFLLEPFGKSNPKIILGDKNLKLYSINRIWKKQNYISLKIISSNGKIFDFVYFGDANEFDKSFSEKYGENNLKLIYSGKANLNSKFFIDILYEVKIETYNFNEMIKYFLYKYRF